MSERKPIQLKATKEDLSQLDTIKDALAAARKEPCTRATAFRYAIRFAAEALRGERKTEKISC